MKNSNGQNAQNKTVQNKASKTQNKTNAKTSGGRCCSKAGKNAQE